ncbi:hypothetical protein [Mesomycoplasma hyopneumoniae]|nr:hypothetical protein [Mesomycoplasma hyopneumoniae]
MCIIINIKTDFLWSDGSYQVQKTFIIHKKFPKFLKKEKKWA